MGLNKLFTSKMRMRFQDKKLINFSAYKNPDAQFIPPHELTAEIQKLDGFNWRIIERPTLFDVAPYMDSVPHLISVDSIITNTKQPLNEDESIPVDNEPGKIPDRREGTLPSQILLKKD